VKIKGIAITGWLVIGHAILGGLYWLLLQIPESNVLMLTASALTAAAILVGVGLVSATGLAWWSSSGFGAAAGTGVRRTAWGIAAVAVAGLFWFATGLITTWHAGHATEFDAWFLASFGWTDVSWFHVTFGWIQWFVRYVFGVGLALALLAAAVLGGARAVVSIRWAARAFHWQTVLITTFAMLVGFYLPWQFVVPWRPASLPPTWVQPAFAAVKLGVVFIVMNAAWAIVLRRVAAQAAATAPAVGASDATNLRASSPV
jgi:hypothetical protein